MSTGDDMGDDTMCADRVATPGLLHTHAAPVVAGNPSNAGQGCMLAGTCHGPGPAVGAPEYQFAGTLYKIDLVTPQAGATIRVKNMAGQIATAITDTGGNFFIPANTLQNPFPSNTQATACPQLTPMQSQVAQGQGNCNQGGTCHGTGGAQPMTLSDSL